MEAVPNICERDQIRFEYSQVRKFSATISFFPNHSNCDVKVTLIYVLVVMFHLLYREKLAQAYDFALEKIGMDLHSFSIWSDYVQFLRGVDAAGSFAENQKITAVRRVYQKAVLTPIIGIEILWKEYIQFEQNINPIISEKMSLERSRDYMNARRVAKELEAVTKGLNRNLPAIPPTLTKEEVRQVELWKKYIAFEKSNPLRSEDTALVTRRVMFATEQCLLVLNHHPAVWHQAAQYLDQSSKLLTEKGVRTIFILFVSELDDTITQCRHKEHFIGATIFDFIYSVIRIKILATQFLHSLMKLISLVEMMLINKISIVSCHLFHSYN